MSAIGAVDMALWDIKAKAANMPLYQLLGGRCRTGVMVYGHTNGEDIQQTVDEVLRYHAMGYQAVRALSGMPGLEKVYRVDRTVAAFWDQPACFTSRCRNAAVALKR